MNYYSKFDINTVPELTVVKTGIFNPSFELTNGSYSYGRLFFKGWFEKTGYIEIANANWTVRRKNWYCSSIVLTDTMGVAVAETKTTGWKSKVNLEFTDGSVLQYNCDGLFSKIQSWYSTAYGNLVNFKVKPFSYKTPLIISFEPIIAKSNINPLLLAFMGINVIMIRRAQAAAASYY